MQSRGVHGLCELSMILVLYGDHPRFARGVDVLFTVIDEENVAGIFAKAFGGVVVDGQVGLSDAEPVREGVVVEAMQPVEAGKDAGFHTVANVGEDARFVSGTLELVSPGNHVVVRLGPECYISFVQACKREWIKGAVEVAGNSFPVSNCSKSAAVIRVAMAPVSCVEVCFICLQEAFHALPGMRIGWPAEHEAVVEEDCMNDRHWLNCRARRVG